MRHSGRLLLVVATLGAATLVESASTKVNKKHPLLTGEATEAVASIYFIRPSLKFRGLNGAAVSIHLSGKELLELGNGQYTLVRIKPWEGEIVVKSWTVLIGGSMSRVKESRPFSFVAGRQYYVLVEEKNRPPAGAWDPDWKGGDSFPPVAITEERASEAAAGLTPIGDAVQAPLAK